MNPCPFWDHSSLWRLPALKNVLGSQEGVEQPFYFALLKGELTIYQRLNIYLFFSALRKAGKGSPHQTLDFTIIQNSTMKTL
jgi:hypothetical protein